jgi:toxin ParE1/3/4
MPTPRRVRVTFTSAALDDLDVAFAFVSERNRSAALEMISRLEEMTERLSRFAELGAPLPAEQFELTPPGIRFLVVEPYVMFYRVAEDGVVILRVLHVRQDALGTLFE